MQVRSPSPGPSSSCAHNHAQEEPHDLAGALALATGALRHGVAARNTNALSATGSPVLRLAIR